MQISNFGRNLQTFILGNGLSQQQVADMINREMFRLDGKNERVYMANDVWTIVGRGSTPRNHLVMVAIANVIGKPLDSLIVSLYDMADLRRNDLRVVEKSDNAPQKSSSRPDIAKLFDNLNEQDREFVSDLACGIEIKDDGAFLSLLLTVYMPLDGMIDIRMYQHDGSYETSNLLSDWQSFFIHLRSCDYDPCAVLAELVKDPLLYPFSEGLRVNVTPCSVTRYREESETDDEQMKNSYIVKVKVDIDREDVMLLYEKSLDYLKKRLEELKKEQEPPAPENNEKE